MDSEHHSGFSVEFEAGVVSPVAGSSFSGRAYKIGWLIKAVDVDSASIRYRCFHFARVLAPRYESRYFTSTSELQNSLAELDAIIIVKRVDKTVPGLVAKARFYGVPVFLDLCDDMLAPNYIKNEFGVNLLRFLGLVPFLAGVTVPTAEMADRIQSYASDNGYSDLQVHVIPDIAETWDIYRATYKAVKGTDLPAKLKKPRNEEGQDLKKVVWFGNYGASHSNFGIFSLKPALKSLKAVNEDIPLQLIVISNSEAVYNGLVHNAGFPTRYVPWSAATVYSELADADAALLTTGDDDFCAIKSSGRLLQAFAAGIPVISAKGAAVAEFDEAIAIGRMRDALRNCLGPARSRFVQPRLEAARRVLERYTPERLGGIWASILKKAISGRRRARPGLRKKSKVLFVVEPGDKLSRVKPALGEAKRLAGLDYELLISTDLLADQPEFNPVLRMARKIPRFFSGSLEGGRNLLLDFSAIVVERPSAPVARSLSLYARQLGVQILTSQEAANGSLELYASLIKHSTAATSSIRAGPYEEWLNGDHTVDWAFVVHEKSRGWILDAICREIGSRQPDSWQVSYVPGSIPEAKNYFFSHYALLENFLEQHPERLQNSKVFVWYTHPREENPVAVAKLLLAFDSVTKVVFACESNRQTWIDRGLPEEKTAVVLGAADPALFRYHQRGNGVVGLSSSFYERKNPDLLLEVMKLLPHRDFLLLGRKWNRYALFEEMKALPNFTYKSAPYRNYPDIYATFDVFLSISSLEGGPIPLIEAMMSNAVPVASRTGFAPDVIRHGENGFIFDLDAAAEEIADMIEAAFDLTGNVRETVEDFDWDNFSAAIMKLAE